MVHVKVFDGCVITLGRTILTSDKSKLNSTVRKNGGGISAFLNQNTTHYLCREWEPKAFQSDPFVHQILHISFLTDSVEAGERCDEEKYRLFPNGASSAHDLLVTMFKRSRMNIESIKHALECKRNEDIVQTNQKLQEHTEQVPKCSVNKSLQRIQETIAKRNARKEELSRPVEVASVELPTFEYHILSEGDYEVPSYEIEAINEEENQAKASESSQESFQSASETKEKPAEPFSWFASSFGTAEESEKEERKRKLREAKELKEQRKKEEETRKQEAKAKKKAQIRKNIALNAEEGKKIQRKWEQTKKEEKNLEMKKKEEEREVKQKEWQEEQERRRMEWQQKKQIMRDERKAKRQRFKEQKCRILKEDKEEKNRKIFVGKISFDDILHPQDGSILNEFAQEALMDARKAEFLTLLEQFGEVDKVKPFWEKNFLFVVYIHEEDALQAFITLSEYTLRKELCAAIRSRLKASLGDVRFAPLPTFYVRQPK